MDVQLLDYVLTFPHDRFWASMVADLRPQIALGALGALSLLLIVLAIGRALRRVGFRSVRRPSLSSAFLVAMALASLVYLVGNASLVRFGGHPCDMTAEKVYSYAARTYA